MYGAALSSALRLPPPTRRTHARSSTTSTRSLPPPSPTPHRGRLRRGGEERSHRPGERVRLRRSRERRTSNRGDGLPHRLDHQAIHQRGDHATDGAGQFSLDDTLQKFLPTFPTQANRVTVRHLLPTSGIKSYTSLGPKWGAWYASTCADSLVALFANEPFDFAG
jgi:hypothetical protein